MFFKQKPCFPCARRWTNGVIWSFQLQVFSSFWICRLSSASELRYSYQKILLASNVLHTLPYTVQGFLVIFVTYIYKVVEQPTPLLHIYCKRVKTKVIELHRFFFYLPEFLYPGKRRHFETSFLKRFQIRIIESLGYLIFFQ